MHDTILNSAKKTLRIETQALTQLADRLGDSFVKVIQLLLTNQGRVVVTGIGKSAIIGQKMVATFNSTGTPALFMHAAEAIHGDLGLVQKNDVVICISKSGSSPEIKVLCPLVKNMGNTLVAITGNLSSFLAQQAAHVLDTTVEEEACPNNLAPTASTTAQLAMGDALAVALMEARGFSSKDFARYHPGGALGKRLFLKVGDLLDEKARPAVQHNETIANTIVAISSGRLGATAVLREEKLIGVITDGDVRRMLQKHADLSEICAADIMTAAPKTIAFDALAVDAFSTMEQNSITQMVVVEEGAYKGIVHLHDILKEGIY